MNVDGSDRKVGDVWDLATYVQALQEIRGLRRLLSKRVATWVDAGCIDIELAVDALITLAQSVGWRPRTAHMSAVPAGHSLKVRIEMRGVADEPSGRIGTSLPQPSVARDLLDACTTDWGVDEQTELVCLWVELVLAVVGTPPSLLTTSFVFSRPTVITSNQPEHGHNPL